MGTLGFHKNDYKILTSDAIIEEDNNAEDEQEMSYSEILEREDLAIDILHYLCDKAENMSVPIFDKCRLRDVTMFLSNYDPSFYRGD